MSDQHKTVVLKTTDDDLSELADLVSRGYTPLCPVCKQLVLVIDSKEKMTKYQSSRGAHCSQDPSHYGFYLLEKRTDDFLKDLD